MSELNSTNTGGGGNQYMLKRNNLMKNVQQIQEVDGEDEDNDDLNSEDKNDNMNKNYEYKVVPSTDKQPANF